MRLRWRSILGILCSLLLTLPLAVSPSGADAKPLAADPRQWATAGKAHPKTSETSRASGSITGPASTSAPPIQPARARPSACSKRGRKNNCPVRPENPISDPWHPGGSGSTRPSPFFKRGTRERLIRPTTPPADTLAAGRFPAPERAVYFAFGKKRRRERVCIDCDYWYLRK